MERQRLQRGAENSDKEKWKKNKREREKWRSLEVEEEKDTRRGELRKKSIVRITI